MLNPLTRSQGKQNISLINSQEKVNTLQDKLVRDFFKKKQTNRSLIDVKPKIKSNSSSSISSKEFFSLLLIMISKMFILILKIIKIYYFIIKIILKLFI